MPWPRSLTFASPAVAAPLAAVGLTSAVRTEDTGTIVVVGVIAVLCALILFGAIALARRLPRSPIAPLLAWMGLNALAVVSSDADHQLAVAKFAVAGPGGGAPFAGGSTTWAAVSAFTAGCWTWLFVPIGMLLVIFPDGRPATRLGRVTLIALPTAAAGFQLTAAFASPHLAEPLEYVPNPLPYLPFAVVPLSVLLAAFFGLLVTAVIANIQRYRRSSGLVRSQLRWLRLGGIGLPATLLLCWLSYLLLNGPDLVGFGLLAMYTGIPAVTLIALLHHDRYDVDDAMASAAAYTAMVAVLLGVFSAASIGSGLMIGRDSFGVAVTVTALVAFGLGVAHRRIQRTVARVLFPVRIRALRAVGDLRRRIEVGRGQPEEIITVLAAALRDPGLAVAERPTHSEAGLPSTPVILGDTTIAHLVPGPSARRRVPRIVADAAALLIETARLRAALTDATREIEASRERLVMAGFAERKRLERDLHDGAQQRLVSLGMSLRLLQRSLGADSRRLAGDLDRAVAEIGTTVSELRLLAQGLRPSSLDDGLHAALAYLATTSPIPLELRICDRELPDKIATTAYFVVSEAVANATKHACAERIDVHVGETRDGICVEVRDDGRGGAEPRPGSGLAGLADRVAAVGGRLDLASRPEVGTTVRAELPCGS